MVVIAALDVSCSSVVVISSEKLDNMSVGKVGAGESWNKSKSNHYDRTNIRRTAESAVTVPRAKRAKFEPRRRQQVANVRKKGACMRCRIKKLPVGAGVC